MDATLKPQELHEACFT